MQKLIGAGHFFSASHRDPVRKELHGHSYEVVAWWPEAPEHDAVVIQKALKLVLRDLDHKTLPDELSRMEAIAEFIRLRLMGCVAVDISRPLERLYMREFP